MQLSLVTFLFISLSTDSAETRWIDPWVTQAVSQGRHVAVIIRFKYEATKKVQQEYYRLRKHNLDERLTPPQVDSYVSSLDKASKETQAVVLQLIRKQRVCYPVQNCIFGYHDYHQIWLTNELSVRDFDKNLSDVLEAKFNVDQDLNVTEVLLDPAGAHPDYSTPPSDKHPDCDTDSAERPPHCPSASDERPGCSSASEEYPADCASGSEEPQECTSSSALHPKCTTGSGSRATKLKARSYHKMMYTQQAWDHFGRGNGTVVGIIDSGVAKTHKFISSRHREHYGWFDATHDWTTSPVDEDGHGTCVASVIISLPETNGNAVGVAPDAEWIACKAWKFSPPRNEMNRYSHIIRCMQFMACPTDALGKNPKCALRPRIVNHSWTIPIPSESLSFTDELFDIFEDLDILIVQSAGNRGPTCETMPHSASHEYTLTVGCINEQKDHFFISSRGPTKDGRSKPDLVAPGVKIKCFRNKKSSEGWWIKQETGVSLATAQVSGVAALLFSAVPTLTAVQARYILKTSTAPDFFTFTVQKCSPNDHDFGATFGNGIVNAKNAICTARHGPFPRFNITGHVVPLKHTCPAVCIIPHST